MSDDTIIVPVGVPLPGLLDVPKGARGIVVFAHGSGSSHLSPRNQKVAAELRASGHFGTLLFDLLSPEEDENPEMRFNMGLLAERLIAATHWLKVMKTTEGLAVGYFGASTGSAAALLADADLPYAVDAIVSRGGRPDLAAPILGRITAPTLLIVGGDDTEVLELNRQAYEMIGSEKALEIVPGATHLFEEPGALEEVSRLSADWFERYLGTPH